MSIEKTLAIVVRLVEFSESSCVVTMFTREFGKIGALAKGARRPKSPFEAALDLLAICRVVFIRKSSDALDLLTEARLERRFRAASRDLTRLYAGYYIAELLRELTEDGDPHPELFDAATETLIELDGQGDVPSVVLRFEMNLLRLLGHLPTWDACASCGQPAVEGPRVAFGPLAGGVLCGRCRVGQRQVISVSAGVIRTLQRFASADSESWRRTVIDRQQRGEIRGLMNHYMTGLMGKRPLLLAYLGNLTT